MASVLIPIAPGFEELEAVTLIDILRRAQFDVITAGLIAGTIKGSRGTILLPDTEIEDIKDKEFDLIALPGGQPGTNNLNQSTVLRNILQSQTRRKGWIAAICAAPSVLVNLGLVNGYRITSYPEAVDKRLLSQVFYIEESVVVDRNVITSRGPGTAMDFALEIIELLGSKELRTQVEAPLQRP